MRAGLADYVLQQAPQPPHPRTRPQEFRLPQGPDRGSAVLAAVRGQAGSDGSGGVVAVAAGLRGGGWGEFGSQGVQAGREVLLPVAVQDGVGAPCGGEQAGQALVGEEAAGRPGRGRRLAGAGRAVEGKHGTVRALR
ncbi:hypothetical protein ACF1DV_32345 [Streptomyces achromogenes]|uniref:hypothetical protein n=1 Tax=Streptomyces achromogenes TaxID=67255 RepID=UPI0036FC9C84